MDIICAPFSAGSVRRNLGSKDAPKQIIKALKEWSSLTVADLAGCQITTLKLNNTHIQQSHDIIYKEIKKHKTGVLIGGDHSITYPSFKGFSEHYKKPGIIVFDAHPDVVHNEKIPSHEDYLRSLIEQGFVDKKHVLLIGIRDVIALEQKYLDKKKIPCAPMDFHFNMEAVLKKAKKQFNSCDGIYISLDIDSIDPAHAPGTGCPEPGGLNSREIIYAVQELKKQKNVKFLDVIEVDPHSDVKNMTVKIAARFIEEFAF